MTGDTDWQGESAITVPTRLHDFSLDMAMGENVAVRIPERDMVAPSLYGSFDISAIPEIRLTIKELHKKYKSLNTRNFYATLGRLSFAVFQHRYNGILKTISENRTSSFFNGNWRNTVNLYGTSHYFFDRVRGGRNRMIIVGHKETFIAPISEAGEYFNMSNSDLMQVILAHGLLLWDELPPDARVFFENIIIRFDEHVKKFTVDTNMAAITK